jgi:putative Mn2+ efflux pump MntP
LLLVICCWLFVVGSWVGIFLLLVIGYWLLRNLPQITNNQQPTTKNKKQNNYEVLYGFDQIRSLRVD